MAQHPNQLANLKQGYNRANVSGKIYFGTIFRNCFTAEDAEKIAQTVKDIAYDSTQKTTDRLKALDLLLRKLVADEAPEEPTTPSMEQLIKELNDAGFDIVAKPVSPSTKV